MSDGDRGADEELLDRLRRLAALVDPVPPHVDAAARAAIGWRDPDAALADLVAVGAPAAAGARGGGRLFTFATPDLTIEVETTPTRAGTDVVGQVVPTGQAQVSVRHRDGTSTTAADHLGRFMVSGLPRGPLRILVVRDDVRIGTETFLG